MESRSSESRYSSNSYSNTYSSAYSSESSAPSESRRKRSTRRSSESANESRTLISSESSFPNVSSESRSTVTKKTNPRQQYNSLDDIDRLIKRLEKSTDAIPTSNTRVNEVLDERKRKIEELKELVKTARQEQEEEALLRQLQEENLDIDNAISSINKGLRLR